jgi:CRISPR/Cas system-associated endoribonuclease Cas2
MSFVKYAAIALIAALPLGALAQTKRTEDVDKRQANQQQRIDKGVKSGELTRKEAAKLRKEQDRIAKMEQKAMADGKMSKKEAARIKKAQDKASQNIKGERADKDLRKK